MNQKEVDQVIQKIKAKKLRGKSLRLKEVLEFKEVQNWKPHHILNFLVKIEYDDFAKVKIE